MDQSKSSYWSPSTEKLPPPLWGPWSAIGLAGLAIAAGALASAPFALLLDTSGSNVLASNPGVALTMTAISQTSFLIAAVLLVMRKPVLSQLGLKTAPPRGWIDYAIALAACLLLGIVINSFRKFVLGHDIYADLKQLAFLFQIPIWPLSFLVVAVLAPIAEEVLFRGVLLPACANTVDGFWGGAVASTLVWTALHFGNAYSISGMILVFMLGMIFSWLFAVTGSLRVPIAAHMFNNALACALLQTGAV